MFTEFYATRYKIKFEWPVWRASRWEHLLSNLITQIDYYVLSLCLNYAFRQVFIFTLVSNRRVNKTACNLWQSMYLRHWTQNATWNGEPERSTEWKVHHFIKNYGLQSQKGIDSHHPTSWRFSAKQKLLYHEWKWILSDFTYLTHLSVTLYSRTKSIFAGTNLHITVYTVNKRCFCVPLNVRHREKCFK